MSFEFKLPDLGEGIHEAEILAVKIAEGDKVVEDQPIFEVETDKAVVEIPCPVAGVVKQIHVKAGVTATVGNVLITIETTDQKNQASVTDKKTSSTKEQPVPKEVREPVLSATASVASRLPESPSTKHTSPGPVAATPATRRMARELGVDLKLLHGTGSGGRVVKEDVHAFAEGVTNRAFAPAPPSNGATAKTRTGRSEPSEPFTPQPMTAQPFSLPDFSKLGPIERIPVRSIRRKIAQNMAQSWSHIPHVTHFDEVDITETDAFRAKHEWDYKDRGGRLTLTVFALKAVAKALQEFPMFNSSLDESTGEIIYKYFYNIGIAVATERGLIVPVIKDVDKKSLAELSVELADLAKKTREGKVELERLQGGTFTITNIGAIGGTGAVPIVNFPESAILALAKAQLRPMICDGNIVARLMLNLCLSFDHRVTDGAEAAHFVRHIANLLTEPLSMFLEA